MNTGNYWGGYNADEDYRILLYAKNEEEAAFLAEEYAEEACLEGSFSLSYYGEPENVPDILFDCDYIIEDTLEKGDVRYIGDVLGEFEK